ncbi:MAG TPA: hypothetical protein VFN11_19435 [Ktedonobacterales bacterium]|nr:hypothetical protein [Ktedonobacterales bacterium]
MIPANELAAMQAEANKALDTPITVSRITAPATGTWGQATGAYTQIGSCNALFSTPSGPILAQYVAMIGALTVWSVAVPGTQDVKTGDRIQIVATGETFMVHDARHPQSYGPLLNLVVAEVR